MAEITAMCEWCRGTGHDKYGDICSACAGEGVTYEKEEEVVDVEED